MSINWILGHKPQQQHAVSKTQSCLPEVTERAVEVQDKTC